MYSKNLLKSLQEKNILSPNQAGEIENFIKNQPFSVHWELRSILYLGISCLASGLGVLIYKNIDTVGHNILIGLVALAMLAAFYYAQKHAQPFSWEPSKNTQKLDDYALLAAAVLFLILEGYLQYQFNLFGNRYGMAALLSAIVFFICAYRFDHRGVLTMAITALAAWIGIKIAPFELWKNTQFNSEKLAITALLLGILLVVVGWFSEQKNLKKHFAFTFLLFGGNLAFAASLFGLLNFETKPIYFLSVIILAYFSITYARKYSSYLFLLMGVIYGYIALTYGIFKILPNNVDVFFYLLYFFASAGGVIFFLIRVKNILKINK